jgi:hypothetical protein
MTEKGEPQCHKAQGADDELDALSVGHGLWVIGPQLEHARVGMAMEDLARLCPERAMPAQHAGFPHEEGRHVGDP